MIKHTIFRFMNATNRGYITLVLLLILVLMIFVLPAEAGVEEWTSIGPDGGYVGDIVVDPVNPSIVYVAGAAAVYKSTDGGSNWIAILDRYFNKLAIDPTSPSTIFGVARGFGLSKSTDSGVNWTSSSQGLTTSLITCIAIDPSNTSTVYVGSMTGVFKSIDGGASWNAANNGMTSIEVRALAVDPGNPSIIYAGTWGSGVFKSIDGGVTWLSVNTDLIENKVNAIVINPANPPVVYAGTEYGIYGSTDGGAHWNLISSSLPYQGGNVLDLAIPPSSPLTLYAASYGVGVVESTDGGVSWTVINTGLTNTNVTGLAIDPLNVSIIYVGSLAGVFKSTDSGMSWGAVNNGLNNTDIRSLAVHPSTPSTIYAGLWGRPSVSKSTDGGASWKSADIVSALNGIIYSLAIDPFSPATIYAGSYSDGVFKSTDGGMNWNFASSGLNLTNAGVWSIVVDPSDSAIIYIGTTFGVFKSIDYGGAWSNASAGLTNTDVRSLTIDPTNHLILYAGMNAESDDVGLFKSTDGGASWSAANSGLSNTIVFSIAIDPQDSSVIYAGTGNNSGSGAMFKSTDGGATWSSLNLGPTYAPTIWKVVINPANPSTVYAGSSIGVLRSTDGGLSWIRIINGLPNSGYLYVYGLAIDSLQPATVYAGTQGRGVFAWTEGAILPTTYAITASAGPGGIIDPSGTLTVNKGGTAQFTITPDTGYQVLSVIVNGANKGAVTSYIIGNVQTDQTIAVYFKAVTYTITATAEANGVISSPGVNTVNPGSSMAFTITPSIGYHIADVLVDSSSVGAVTTYTLTDIQAHHTISASFAENAWFLIDASAGPNGTITPSGNGSVLGGTNHKYTITPASGYRVADVVVDDVSKGALVSYTFYDVQAPHTISVTFTQDVYTITATVTNYDSSTPGNGSITVNGDAPPATVNAGAGITYTITPDPDYVVYSVLVDGAQKGGVTSFNFPNVQANHTIAAYVRPITYTVTTSAGAGGSITPVGTSTFNIHTNPPYTITPNAGYSVADVTVDGGSVGAVTSYTFTDITANHTIAATFAANTGITITASAGPNGFISPSGSVSINAGANQKFTFTPDPGYRVADVVVNGVSKGALASYTFSYVQAPSHTISVSFVPNVYSISITAATGGSVTVSGSSIPTTIVNGGESSTITVNPGVSVTLNITTDPGRSVRSLVDNGSYKYNIMTYTLTNIRKDHTINVYFK